MTTDDDTSSKDNSGASKARPTLKLSKFRWPTKAPSEANVSIGSKPRKRKRPIRPIIKSDEWKLTVPSVLAQEDAKLQKLKQDFLGEETESFSESETDDAISKPKVVVPAPAKAKAKVAAPKIHEVIELSSSSDEDDNDAVRSFFQRQKQKRQIARQKRKQQAQLKPQQKGKQRLRSLIATDDEASTQTEATITSAVDSLAKANKMVDSHANSHINSNKNNDAMPAKSLNTVHHDVTSTSRDQDTQTSSLCSKYAGSPEDIEPHVQDKTDDTPKKSNASTARLSTYKGAAVDTGTEIIPCDFAPIVNTIFAACDHEHISVKQFHTQVEVNIGRKLTPDEKKTVRTRITLLLNGKPKTVDEQPQTQECENSDGRTTTAKSAPRARSISTSKGKAKSKSRGKDDAPGKPTKQTQNCSRLSDSKNRPSDGVTLSSSEDIAKAPLSLNPRKVKSSVASASVPAVASKPIGQRAAKAAQPRPKRRARKGKCALCTTCPCQKNNEAETLTLDLKAMSRSDGAVERALIRRMQKLEKSSERMEEQTDGVRRKLKKHRRDMWKKSQNRLTSGASNKVADQYQFLPDAEEFEHVAFGSPVISKQTVQQATTKLFPNISFPGGQPTLTQMLGVESSKSGEAEKAESVNDVAIEPQSNETQPPLDSVQATVHDLNEDFDGEQNEVDVDVNATKQPACSETDVPLDNSFQGVVGERRGADNGDMQSFMPVTGDPLTVTGAVKKQKTIWKALTTIDEKDEENNESRTESKLGQENDDDLWSLTQNNPAEPESNTKMFFKCDWDDLFKADTAAQKLNNGEGGLTQLVDILSQSTLAQNEEDGPVQFADLSQRGQLLAKEIEDSLSTEPVKLSVLNAACPTWQENVAFALNQNKDNVQGALEEVIATRRRNMERKERMIREFEKEDMAHQVFEKALLASMSRFACPNNSTTGNEMESSPEIPAIIEPA